MCKHTCDRARGGSQVTACGGQLSPSTMWNLEIGVRLLHLVARWPHLHLTSSFEFSHVLNDLGEVICKMRVTSASRCRVPGLSLNQINPVTEKHSVREGDVVCEDQDSRQETQKSVRGHWTCTTRAGES